MNPKTILQRLKSAKGHIDTRQYTQTEAPTEKSAGSPIEGRELEDGSAQPEKVLVGPHPMPCYTLCSVTADDERCHGMARTIPKTRKTGPH